LQQNLRKGDIELPENIIFALGALSGIFTVLIIWACIEKRREDEPWIEGSYSTGKDNYIRWFLDFIWRKNTPNSAQDDNFL
jgi:hypothetical protein